MGIKDKIKPGAGGNGVIGRFLGSGRRKAVAAGAAGAVVIALAASIMLKRITKFWQCWAEEAWLPKGMMRAK